MVRPTTTAATRAATTASTQRSAEVELRRAARAVLEPPDHQEPLAPTETLEWTEPPVWMEHPATTPLLTLSHRRPTSASTAHPPRLDHLDDPDPLAHQETLAHPDKTERPLFPDPQDHQDRWDPLAATDNPVHPDSLEHPDRSPKFPVFLAPLDHPAQWDLLDHLVSLALQAAHCQDHQDHQETQEWTVLLETLARPVHPELPERPAPAEAATTAHHHVPLPATEPIVEWPLRCRDMLIPAIVLVWSALRLLGPSRSTSQPSGHRLSLCVFSFE